MKKISQYFPVICLLFVISSIHVSAQNGIDYYLTQAYKNNPVIKELANNIDINNIEKSLNKAKLSSPQVSVTSNYLFSPYFNNNGQYVTTNPGPDAVGYDIGITNGGLYSAQLNIEKNILNGGIVDAYNSQSQAQINNNKNKIELQKHNLKKDVINQYILCFQSEKLYQISKSISDTLKQQLNITSALVEKGYAKQSDYLLLNIEYENSRVASAQYLNDYKSGLLQLNSICGIEDTSFVNLDKLNITAADINDSQKFMKQYELEKELMNNEENIFETKYKPQLNVFFNTGLNAVELDGIQKKFGLSAGVNFSLPIYDGGQKDLSKQKTEIALKTLDAYKQNQSVQINNKIKEKQNSIKQLKDNLTNIRRQISQYEKLINMSQAELGQGQLSMIDFINIIKNYLELKKSEVNIYSYYQQAINEFNYWNW